MRKGECMGGHPGRSYPWVAIIIVLIASGGMIIISFMTSREAAHAERLPVVAGVVVQDSPIGREVIIEGRISDTMLPRYKTLVAYERQHREEDSDGDTRWVTDEEMKPPLQVDTQNGRIQIEARSATSDYGFDKPPATLYESDDRRYNGFRVDDTVMAMGMVQQGSEGNVLDASVLHGGTKETYVLSKRSIATVTFWSGLAGIGLALGIPGALFIWRTFR
jgi:hypothetical protein